MAVFGLCISTLMLVLTGAGSADDFLLTTNTNRQSLHIVTKVIMGLMLTRSIVWIN